MGSLNKNTNFKKIAKEVIDLEIKALQKLKKTLNKNFDKAVTAIVNCQSKIILCGVGKSGIIANKISATLSSIGTPSFSLSANDCSHGDMGSISRKDVLILISYSGNSIELKNTKTKLQKFLDESYITNWFLTVDRFDETQIFLVLHGIRNIRKLNEWKKKINDEEQEAYKKNNFVVLSSDYKKMIRDKKLRFYETK